MRSLEVWKFGGMGPSRSILARYGRSTETNGERALQMLTLGDGWENSSGKAGRVHVQATARCRIYVAICMDPSSPKAIHCVRLQRHIGNNHPPRVSRGRPGRVSIYHAGYECDGGFGMNSQLQMYLALVHMIWRVTGSLQSAFAFVTGLFWSGRNPKDKDEVLLNRMRPHGQRHRTMRITLMFEREADLKSGALCIDSAPY